MEGRLTDVPRIHARSSEDTPEKASMSKWTPTPCAHRGNSAKCLTNSQESNGARKKGWPRPSQTPRVCQQDGWPRPSDTPRAISSTGNPALSQPLTGAAAMPTRARSGNPAQSQPLTGAAATPSRTSTVTNASGYDRHPSSTRNSARDLPLIGHEDYLGQCPIDARRLRLCPPPVWGKTIQRMQGHLKKPHRESQFVAVFS